MHLRSKNHHPKNFLKVFFSILLTFLILGFLISFSEKSKSFINKKNFILRKDKILETENKNLINIQIADEDKEREKGLGKIKDLKIYVLDKILIATDFARKNKKDKFLSMFDQIKVDIDEIDKDRTAFFNFINFDIDINNNENLKNIPKFLFFLNIFFKKIIRKQISLNEEYEIQNLYIFYSKNELEKILDFKSNSHYFFPKFLNCVWKYY